MIDKPLYKFKDGVFFDVSDDLKKIKIKGQNWRKQLLNTPILPGALTMPPTPIAPYWYRKLRKIPHKIPMHIDGDWTYKSKVLYIYIDNKIREIQLYDSGDIAITVSGDIKYIQLSNTYSRLQVNHNNRIRYIQYD